MGFPDFGEELRQLYPGVSYLWIAGAFWLAAGTFVSVGLLRLIAPKLPLDRHWTEIARVRLPVLASLSVLSIVSLAMSFAMGGVSHEQAVVPGWILGAMKVFGIFSGYFFGLRVFFRNYVVSSSVRVNKPSFLETLGSNLLLRWAHILLACLVATFLQTPSVSAVVVLPLFGGFVVWYALGGGVQVLRLIGWARPLDRVREDSLRELASIPSDVPLYELRSRSANAFAFPSKRVILATTECLAVLDDPQLASVLKHELGHLHETRRLRVVRPAAGFFFSMLIAVASLAIQAWGFLIGLYSILAAMIVVVLVSRRLLRDTEKHADEHGKEGDPHTYAIALERIYEANGIPAVMRDKGGLHGHLYDRLLALGVTPSYPRPLPPPWGIGRNVVATVLGMSLGFSHSLYGNKNDLWALGVAGGTSHRIGTMAYAANASGDARRAIALYGFQSTFEKAPDPLANLAIVSGNAKQCELSEQAIAAARARFNAWDPRLKVVFRNAVASVLLCNPSSTVASSIRNEMGPDPEDAYDDFDPTLD